MDDSEPVRSEHPEPWLEPPVLQEPGFSVSALRHIPDEYLEEVRVLYGLLDPALARLRREQVEAALAAPAVRVFAAMVGARIGGLATLVVAPTLGRTRAWAEDLVVHPDYRRMGIAKALMDACAAGASKLGAATVEGTVHPERSGAAALYARTGWEFGTSKVVSRRLEIT
jgi:GNAT superfamily N-acetyltransferase